MTQRYETYKDSGVQWLGEIPGHWRCTRLKYITSKIGSGSTPTGGADVYQDSGVLFIRSQNVYNYGLELDDVAYISEAIHQEMKGTHVQPGDILYNITGGSIGRCCLAPDSLGEANVNQHVSIVRPRNIGNKYLLYSLQSDYCQTQMWHLQTGGNREGLSASAFKQFCITLPPLSEQHSIVSYLDAKCGKIEKMLEGKQKQIELLAEMKQRIIADAVTHGLNPDVKMKATNIPWLPEIPEHWEVKRAKNLFAKQQRPIKEGDDIVTCFRDGEVTLRKNRRTTGFTEATDYSHYQHICKGDLVIHQMDAFSGSSGVSDSDGMGTPVLSVCTANIEGLNHYYYAHILRLMGKNNFILSLYRGIRERSSDFRFETFAKQYLPVPPAKEQEQIVQFINERSSKIDTLTSKLQQEIEAIKEYKQRLISDVVTGQIKV